MSYYLLSAEETRRLLESLNKPFDPCAKLKSAIARTSENKMKGYDEWKCTDSDGERREAEADAFEKRKAEINACSDSIADIDYAISDGFDAEVAEMFSALADASESGMVNWISQGEPICRMPGLAVDAFAKLAKLADRMAALRAKAVSDAAEDDSDD